MQGNKVEWVSINKQLTRLWPGYVTYTSHFTSPGEVRCPVQWSQSLFLRALNPAVLIYKDLSSFSMHSDHSMATRGVPFILFQFVMLRIRVSISFDGESPHSHPTSTIYLAFFFLLLVIIFIILMMLRLKLKTWHLLAMLSYFCFELFFFR
jgi:hypothetical protein